MFWKHYSQVCQHFTGKRKDNILLLCYVPCIIRYTLGQLFLKVYIIMLNIFCHYIQSFFLLDKYPIMSKISLREHNVRIYLISSSLSDILCHWQDYHYSSLFPLLKCSGLNLASWVLIWLSRLEGFFIEC